MSTTRIRNQQLQFAVVEKTAAYGGYGGDGGKILLIDVSTGTYTEVTGSAGSGGGYSGGTGGACKATL